MRYDDSYKLCYVDSPWAYFTTQELDKQWGDDWNDAPYEHNAGSPYRYSPTKWTNTGADANDEPRYDIGMVAFSAELETPADRAASNSPYSVEMINVGAVAWLSTSRWHSGLPVVIPAGTPYPEFVRLVEEVGGTVYEPLGILESHKEK